ncbi:MAG: hypothetical protein A3G96_03915 [Gammaproteobacteria bacterium RIFCSPLOWO2_12_FULL_52_10]|nr:MAG: hypothetical protein A3G96_03915 [Gammaproteobacteria bacterium RIFCSPLOWO2_12_FULL_52_10]
MLMIQIKWVFVLLMSILMVACSQELSFQNDVMPILAANCSDCHTTGGEGYNKSGFNVTNYENLMKGTKFGPVIVPGNSASSPLYQLISHATDVKIQMPPHHKEALAEGRREPLPDAQIAIIGKWIDQGAKNN